MKQCSICHKEKPLEDFHRQIMNLDGRKGECKECYNKKLMVRHKKKKERIDSFPY